MPTASTSSSAFAPLAAPDRFLEIRQHNPYGVETAN